MQRVLSLCLVVVAPALTAAMTIRRLEDADYFGGAYFKFAKCIRVKIPQNNDDDGNAYFYNGAYRSQTIAYASYLKCDQGCGGTCDPTTAYVSELDEVIERALEYSQGYCNACSNQCRRRTEEEGEEQQQQQNNNNNGENYNVDCNTCASQCATLNGNGVANGNDETEYLECQYSYTDDDGLDYYSAPTCAADGSLVMGLFYDDECTIKKSEDNTGFADKFAYNSFHALESICMSCQDGICNDISEDGMACFDGRTVNGQDDEMGVCKTYKRMSKEWQYAKAKKKSPLPIFVFVAMLVGMFSFLSYTYYVRHKSANTASTKTALLEAEDRARDPSPTTTGGYQPSNT